MHQPVAHPVHGLQVELLVGLDGNKTHVLARHRFGDRFGIEEVVLVRLEEGFDELRRDESHVVPLLAQCGADKVRTGTGFDADQRRLQVRGVGQQLLA